MYKDTPYIEPDPTHAPVVLDLGDGLEVMYLKTEKAIWIEYGKMNHNFLHHCSPDEHAFSVRKNNQILFSIKMFGFDDIHTRAYDDEPNHDEELERTVFKYLAPKVLLNKFDSAKPMEDGEYSVVGTVSSLGEGIDITARIENGKLHSINEPAIETSNGYEIWMHEGRHHRIGKPAVIFHNRYDDEDLEVPFTVYYHYGELHRVDGPAVEYADGFTEYFQNSKLHRIDGPARTRTDGNPPEWFIDGELVDISQYPDIDFTQIPLSSDEQVKLRLYVSTK